MAKIWGIQPWAGKNIAEDKTVMDQYNAEAKPEDKVKAQAESQALEGTSFILDDYIGPGAFAKVGATLKAAAGALAGKAMLVGMMDRTAFLQKNPQFSATIFKDSEGLPKELYHGTSKDKPFKAFAKNRRGNFIGEDPAIASQYAVENDSMNLVYDGRRYVKVNDSPNVRPVFVNIQNPYEVQGEELATYVRSSNYAKAQRDIMDRAKALGHDAVIYPDGGIAVADPKQLKSSITGD